MRPASFHLAGLLILSLLSPFPLQRPLLVSSSGTKRRVIASPHWLSEMVSCLCVHILGLPAMCLPGSCCSLFPNAASAPFLNPCLYFNFSWTFDQRKGLPFSGKAMLLNGSLWKSSQKGVLEEGNTHLAGLIREINPSDSWNKGEQR